MLYLLLQKLEDNIPNIVMDRFVPTLTINDYKILANNSFHSYIVLVYDKNKSLNTGMLTYDR